MSEPTTKYLLAKATLCRDLAIKQMSEGEGKQATRNLMRMVKALGEVGIINEREDKNMSEDLVCPWCLDNSKSCKACDDSYEGE